MLSTLLARIVRALPARHHADLPDLNPVTAMVLDLPQPEPTCALCGRPMQGHHPRLCDVAALQTHWAARSNALSATLSPDERGEAIVTALQTDWAARRTQLTPYERGQAICPRCQRASYGPWGCTAGC